MGYLKIYKFYRGASLRDLDIREFIATIIAGRWLLVLSSLSFGLFGVWLASTSPDMYRSEAIVIVNPETMNDTSSSTNMPRALLGLATLSQGSLRPSRVDIALEILQSREFLVSFARNRSMVPDLLAVDRWDPTTGKLILDSNLFDVEQFKWIQWSGEGHFKPTDEDIFVSLLPRVIVERKNDNRGILKISLEHQSPLLAKQWLEWIVHDLNQRMRTDSSNRAADTVARVTDQIGTVSDVDARNFLFDIIRTQTMARMLAEGHENYVFEMLDPPNLPNSRVRPRKVLIVSRWLALGAMIALSILFFRVLFLRQND